ncbi:sorting nexin-8-like isoform X2 [Limulus polyphemus]|uniref:Sorting nexin-8-like isoform X2 n=1 Tax=Limulus polyphemus TaxID=6850 RepID=A0ABM1BUW1_LIMPO|nr:sorting nexin-8-like isoform X2 [Limulus polyphemus]
MLPKKDKTMAADLTSGSVPHFYRDIYDILCPDQQTQLDQDMFIKLLMKSSLPKETLTRIWELVDCHHGYLTRSGVYKALALIAVSQQGKPVNDVVLQNFGCQELPRPSLGDLSDLKALSVRLRREKNPTRLSMSYREVCSRDIIKVTLIPKKKGLILKHVEYEVSSQRFNSVVQRRYNDFVVLHEMLLHRFPYRMIPQLPPKKLVKTDAHFIEERRKALKRFLTLVVRHPNISEDPLIHFFLTFLGRDVQHNLKEQFRSAPDEFSTNRLAQTVEELDPLDTPTQSRLARDLMKHVHSSVSKLRDAADSIKEQTLEGAVDMLTFGRELSWLADMANTDSEWSSGGNETWNHLKKGFKSLHPMFPPISNALAEHSKQEDEDVVEKLNLFLDLLSAYKELHDRYDNSINKMKRKSSSDLSAPQEGEQQERRKHFALHCISMETQLVHCYMNIVGEMLHSLIELETIKHYKIYELWKNMHPMVENMNSADVVEERLGSASPTGNKSPYFPSK